MVGGERPPFADSLERCLVDERGGWGDVPFVPFEHLRGVDHEVAPEDVVTDVTRSGDDPVLWDVAQSRQQRTDERQASDLRRAPRGHRLRVVRARRVTDEEVRSSATDLVGEVEQRVEDVVGAAQRFGSDRPAHSREVGIDPPQPRNAVENRLEASLSLAVVDAGAVEYQYGSTGPVLHVVDHHLAHSDLHPRRLTAQGHRDNAGHISRRGSSVFVKTSTQRPFDALAVDILFGHSRTDHPPRAEGTTTDVRRHREPHPGAGRTWRQLSRA